MLNSTEINNRLMELESKVAYQEDTLDTFNRVIIDQQKQIDNLAKVVQKFESELQELQDTSSTPPHLEPPPPHY